MNPASGDHRRHSIEIVALNDVAMSLLKDGDKTRADIGDVRQEMNSRFDDVLKRLPDNRG